MESDNPDTVRDFVRAGLGVALVPQMTWYSAQEGVASLPIGDQECYRYPVSYTHLTLPTNREV
mgnify:CR=1 FL=1